MSGELPKQYDPKANESAISERWISSKAFSATPDERDNRYVIMMPLPNVTGALHMGHAMDNVMQDLLTRWHRMRGDNTLWMAGTDHAGIATQAVVETRLFLLEQKTRHDIGREELVRRIWDWKDEYQARIVTQQQAMGCSCDWDRQRFTMDKVCARAVRHTFFKMFRDGLIYRGDRLVNWDCHLQTAIADDEVYKETVQGNFWYIRYPVIDPQPGEPDFITIATTRPETMTGDTAVVCHPDPAKALETAIVEAKERGSMADVEAYEARRESHVPQLQQIAAMARDGRKVMLPLLNREIPLVCDEWAKPEMGTGCVKCTPAHDANDYEVWQRHPDQIALLNILEENGNLNENAGPYAGVDRFEARDRIVKDLEAQGLLDRIEDREIEVDHSDRSKTIIEPYLSRQWFVRMGDVEGGVTMGRGTDKEFTAPGLAQSAIDATEPTWQSATGRSVTFHPDSDRYGGLYRNWLGEKRDWCISRQLWWGHRIPVWSGKISSGQLIDLEDSLKPFMEREDIAGWITLSDERRLPAADAFAVLRDDPSIQEAEAELCFLDTTQDENMAAVLKMGGMRLDDDVLDTWFSSGLWPHSTLGWPDPGTAQVGPGQSPIAADGDRADCLSYYYPGSCLVTGRDIITLWVARMVIMGLYNLGDVPFTDVFLHATILDGKGVRMSKSKGNGIDPIDIIEHYGADAMRFVICEMQTGTQDVRLPVQAISPFGGELIDLATAKPGPNQGTYIDPKSGEVFDLVGSMKSEGVPQAKAISERFEDGQKFCNKLWNAARFNFLNLEGVSFRSLNPEDLAVEDRWILSRLSRTITAVNDGLEAYNPSIAIGAAREFFWSDYCDWYLEFIKPRMKDSATGSAARQVVATVLDQVLRLTHPFVPFVTEALWEKLNELAPTRGIDSALPAADLLVHAAWPESRSELAGDEIEARIARLKEVVVAIREIRARFDRPPSQPIDLVLKGADALALGLEGCESLLQHIVNADSVTFATKGTTAKDAATAIVAGMEVYVLGVVDREKEVGKLQKQIEKLDKQIGGAERKLGNEGFLAKAPPEVVKKEKANLTDMQSQRAALLARLQDLQG